MCVLFEHKNHELTHTQAHSVCQTDCSVCASVGVFVSVCVCWCPMQQSILLKSTHSCLAMRQSSNVLVNKNHTHLSPSYSPSPTLVLFVLVLTFSCKTLILFPNAFQISNLMFLSFLSPLSDMKSVTRLFASAAAYREKYASAVKNITKIWYYTDTHIIPRWIMALGQYSATKSIRIGQACANDRASFVQQSTNNEYIL